MKINTIHIGNFGGLNDFSLRLKDGFQVFAAENEFGKSTIMAFIKMMFYGKNYSGRDISKNDRVKYRPWNNEAMYGVIEFIYNNNEYRLEKQFGKSFTSDKTVLMNKSLGQRVELRGDEEVGEYLWNMDVKTFEKTIFISGDVVFSSDQSSDSIAEHISSLSDRCEDDSAVSAMSRINDAMEELVSRSGKSGKLIQCDKAIKELTDQYDNTISIEKLNEAYRKEYDELDSHIHAFQSKKRIDEIEAILHQLGQSSNVETFEYTHRNLMIPSIVLIIAAFLVSRLSIYGCIAIGFTGLIILLISLQKKKVMAEDNTDDELCDRLQEEYTNLNESIKNYTLIDRFASYSLEQLSQRRKDILADIRHIQRNSDSIYNEIQQLMAKRADMQQYYNALRTAYSTLDDIRNEERQEFSPILNDLTTKIFNTITDGRYQNVIIHNDYGADVIEENELLSRNFKYLSRGTIDQLYLSIRIAVSELMSEESMPMFLDDVLERYDDERLEKTLGFLSQFYKDKQAILFTCHGNIANKKQK